MERILLLGGGGHCSVVCDSIRRAFPNIEIGIVTNDEGALPQGTRRAGADADLKHLFAEGWHTAFVAVGSVGSTALRERLAAALTEIGFTIPAVVDPTAIIGSGVTLGNGAYVGARVVINSGAAVGDHAILNTGAIIEHGTKIGAFAHIAPGAVLCGDVVIGAHTHIGAGSAVKQGLSVGEHTVVGLGSVVTRALPSHVVAYGSPARVAREH